MTLDDCCAGTDESTALDYHGERIVTSKECDMTLDIALLDGASFRESLEIRYRLFMGNLEDSHPRIYGVMRRIGLPKPYPYLF